MIDLAGTRSVALLDASVLFSIRVTNLTLELATHNLFQPIWSEAIHDEWTRNLRRKNPAVDSTRIAKRRRDMDTYFPNACVAGFEPLIAGLSLPDPDDRHVFAAAIIGRADVLITFNMDHFPATALTPFGIEPQHPDDFLMHQLTQAPSSFIAAAQSVRGRLHAPPQSADDFLNALARAGLPRVAIALADFKAEL